MIKLLHGDTLEQMAMLHSGSVDMILCDLPYGSVQCKWDVRIPFEPLWEQYKRIIKSNGAIVLFGSQPFTSVLVMSNVEMFKYELIWEKEQGNQPQLCNIQPMKAHENILVFGKGRILYNPQFLQGEPYSDNRKSKSQGIVNNIEHLGKTKFSGSVKNNVTTRYPISYRRFNCDRSGHHPTQKPVSLCEYLIRTYTNEGETVLDNTMGSGTCGVACVNTNRHFIGIERDDKYFEIATKRIDEAVNPQQGDLI